MRAEFDSALLRHTEVLIPNESEFILLVKRFAPCAALLRTAPFNAQGDFTEAALRALSADALHRLCRCLQVPVVIVTYLEARRQGLSLGAAAYIIKPVLPAVLLTTLEQVLGQSWSHRQ